MSKRMRGCFINCICMRDEDIRSSGVMKKIYSQIKVLRTEFEVDHVLINSYGKNQTMIDKIKRRLPFFPVDHHWKYSDQFAGYDFIYFRKSDIDYTVYRFFMDIKKHNPRCKIILEIPTYPYEKENFHGKKDWPMLMKDKVNRRRFHRCVDRIVTYTPDSSLFNIKTIPIRNGLDFSEISLRKVERTYSGKINILAVASFSPCHGCDRIIEGMGDYYENGGDREVILHLVGGGTCIQEYKQLVEKRRLHEKVLFYGWKSGIELDEIYDKADITVDVLAGHRKNYFFSSSLKSREAAAKGLPIITGCKIDYIDDEYEYQLRVKDSDEPILIDEIISFVDSVYKDKSTATISKEIRSLAQSKCDMQTTLRPVIDYISERISE